MANGRTYSFAAAATTAAGVPPGNLQQPLVAYGYFDPRTTKPKPAVALIEISEIYLQEEQFEHAVICDAKKLILV